VLLAILSLASSTFLGLRHRLPPPPPSTNTVDAPEQWFTQTLDHFHPTDGRNWQQRYWSNLEHYKEGGPIFLHIGGEAEANPKWLTYGLWSTLAEQHGAAMFLLEHRYYGQSKPLEDLSTENLVYLSSEQGLADLAEFISAMNTESDLTGPWIAFGGSYPGSMAAWLRYRYPHLVAGSISSSGPLLAKVDYHEYFEVVMAAMDFTGMTECNPAISSALTDIQELSTTEEGWATLTELFTLCNAFDGTVAMDVPMFFEAIVDNLAAVVQYNGRYEVTIDTVCNLMTDEASGTPLERFSQLNTVILNMFGSECLDHQYSSYLEMLKDTSYGPGGVGMRQWIYQTCTEFGWYQTSNQEGHPYGNGFPIEFMEQWCTDAYGPDFGHNMLERVVAATNTQYGGKNPNVDKVVFVHGSIDPWHAMGVLEDISAAAPAIYINGTSHCADMYPDQQGDPPGLTQARIRIGEFVAQWINDSKN